VTEKKGECAQVKNKIFDPDESIKVGLFLKKGKDPEQSIFN
jgi:hypothetical protein